MSFDLFNCFLWHHLHCQDAEHFFAEFPARKQTIFSVEEIKHDQWRCKWWKIGTFLAGFLAQNRLDFVSFSGAENHIFFADDVELTSLVLAFLSVLSPFDSTNYKQFLL